MSVSKTELISAGVTFLSLLADALEEAKPKTNDNLLTIKQVADHIGYDRRTIHRMINDGTFPPSVLTVGDSRPFSLWNLDEVEAWIDGKRSW